MRCERSASIVLQMGGESVGVPVRIPEPEMRLADLAAIACALTQAVADRRERDTAADGRPICCRAGCGACCRQLVPISAPEALWLADAIDLLDAEPRRTLLERFALAAADLERLRIAARLAQAQRSADALRHLANEYFARRVACPFLVGEACSIHPRRPVACRSYAVVSPAAWCSELATAHRVERVPMPPHLSVPLARVAAELAGIGAAPIALSLLPDWLRAHTELRRRSWPSEPLLARFLAEIGAWPERPGAQDDRAAARLEDVGQAG
jgi:Fe-S-cluster containining protein